MKPKPNETALAISQPADLARREEPDVLVMIERLAEKGITPEALEKLCNLREQEQNRAAKREFATAFVDLQTDIPIIQAERAVPNNDGSVRYKYAPYEDIMRQVSPLLRRHGFTVSFSTKVDGARVVAYCTLLHRSGHEKTNEYAVRIGDGPPKATPTQADGAAYTYAQRGALCDALGITVAGRDDDAREIGAPVTDDQAEDLRQRVAETRSDKAKFLRVAGASSYETIPAAQYARLVAMLRQKAAGVPV